MKKPLFSLALALSLLCGCGPSGSVSSQKDDTLTVVATTYPVYLMAQAVSQGVEGVAVERLNTGSVSCLHDYTLSVNDMKKIEQADLIAINGVGLDEFMEDALNRSSAAVVDCSENVALLENLSHHHEEGEEDGHDHGHYDPHYWMDPANAVTMVENLCAALSAADQANAQQYQNNALTAQALLTGWDSSLQDLVEDARAQQIAFPGLITFHDGFQYFAAAYDLPLLEAIEEEAGSEASAKEVLEITDLVNAHSIPVIFTEINGSDATANAICRETGCRSAQLSMIMDGEDSDLARYFDAQLANIAAVVNGFAGREVVILK